MPPHDQNQTTYQGDDTSREIQTAPDVTPAGTAEQAPFLDSTGDARAFTVDLPPVIPIAPLDGGDTSPAYPPTGADLPAVPPRISDVPLLPAPGAPTEILPLPPLPPSYPVPNLPPPAPLPNIPVVPPAPEAPPVPPLPEPPPLPPLPTAPPVPVTPEPPPLPPPPADVPPVDVPPAVPTAGPGDQPLVPPTGDIPVRPAGDIPKFLPVDKEVVTVEGHTIEIIGGPEKEVEGRKAQGDNPYDVRGDCGLVSSRDVLLQFGIHVSEADVVKFAVENHICAYDVSKPSENRGGTGTQAIVEVLHHYGVEAHGEYGGSIEQLATNIMTGRGVIIGVESSVIWPEGEQPGFRPTGKADHAITVTGVAIDQASGTILGFYVNDSGAGNFNRLVPVDMMKKAWVDSGGGSVVTNNVGWAPV